jgi:hypothetical protein
VNPRSVRFTSRAQLSGSELANFRARLRSLLTTPVGAARSQAPAQQASAAGDGPERSGSDT